MARIYLWRGILPRVRRIGRGREHFSDLLLLADPEWNMVRKYLYAGEMYVLYAPDGTPACEAVLCERPDGACELKNLATDPRLWRRGYARALVEYLCARLAGRYGQLYVGTSRPEFYERLGFAYAYTHKNFFLDHYSEPVYDEGELCVDMIYLCRTLTKHVR